MKPIINIRDVVLERHAHGDKFEALDGSVSDPIGARLLGCSFTVLAPGKRAWPLHNHHVNEEMFVILEGHGVVRIGDREHPIGPGDVISSPPGGAATAHQIVNTSDGELRYLSMSTRLPNELVEYPESSKVMMYVGDSPETRTFKFRGRLGAATEYWDGE